ncbi:MauE/DoxX family redox-associated membrane protein [Desulfohalovibrio reitneri]|uniref:MauE/DoxX family redox-associated membrane protein n=1 Tax=Desulfohalovibrio reitneri TaxID=1307759 RepID=UPI000ADC5BC0|nr:MauE/DoxX family redox-associated membrane protein [Desulfohalovibrio reitneri]
MFFAAGVLKMADVGGFTETIRAFGMVPWSLAPVLAVALPVLEVASGVGLALNYRWAHFLAAGMLLVFMAVLLRAKTLGLDIDCGCYGPSDPEAEAFASIDSSLYRDAFMLAALGLVWWRRRAFGEGARSS